jgi:hypothetical protein
MKINCDSFVIDFEFALVGFLDVPTEFGCLSFFSQDQVSPNLLEAVLKVNIKTHSMILGF